MPALPPAMLIRLKKVPGGVVLSCLRPGGGAEVQRTGHGGFFALHDLMHYAVESSLGLERSFFGLVRDGWSFDTFSDKSDPRYHTLPREAVWTEHAVAALSRLWPGEAWRDDAVLILLTEELNAELASVAGADPRRLTTVDVARVCERFEDVSRRWVEVAARGHLELRFPA
jgi:hypothetical protein